MAGTQSAFLVVLTLLALGGQLGWSYVAHIDTTKVIATTDEKFISLSMDVNNMVVSTGWPIFDYR